MVVVVGDRAGVGVGIAVGLGVSTAAAVVERMSVEEEDHHSPSPAGLQCPRPEHPIGDSVGWLLGRRLQHVRCVHKVFISRRYALHTYHRGE